MAKGGPPWRVTSPGTTDVGPDDARPPQGQRCKLWRRQDGADKKIKKGETYVIFECVKKKQKQNVITKEKLRFNLHEPHRRLRCHKQEIMEQRSHKSLKERKKKEWGKGRGKDERKLWKSEEMRSYLILFSSSMRWYNWSIFILEIHAPFMQQIFFLVWINMIFKI